MSRPKGSKNKPKKGIPLPADYVEVGKVEVFRTHGFHDITCSADPAKPMGCEGCSCEMYRRAKRAEKRVEELESKLQELEEYRKMKTKDWTDELQKEIVKHNHETQGQNKPYDAPKLPKEVQDEPDFQKDQERAEKGSKTKPKELSPFLKSRQADKNNMK